MRPVGPPAMLLAALALAGCTSTGTLTPAATADVTAAYNAVCPAVSTGSLDPFAGQFNDRVRTAYSAAQSICAAGVPTNALIAGLDILAIDAALSPYLAKTR